MQAVLKSVPEWKQKLIFHIANNMHCPMHIAKEIARVDKLNWQINSSDLLNSSEKTLVDWVSKSAIKQNRKAVSIEYSLDIAALMHFHARYQNKSK